MRRRVHRNRCVFRGVLLSGFVHKLLALCSGLFLCSVWTLVELWIVQCWKVFNCRCFKLHELQHWYFYRCLRSDCLHLMHRRERLRFNRTCRSFEFMHGRKILVSWRDNLHQLFGRDICRDSRKQCLSRNVRCRPVL